MCAGIAELFNKSSTTPVFFMKSWTAFCLFFSQPNKGVLAQRVFFGNDELIKVKIVSGTLQNMKKGRNLSIMTRSSHSEDTMLNGRSRSRSQKGKRSGNVDCLRTLRKLLSDISAGWYLMKLYCGVPSFWPEFSAINPRNWNWNDKFDFLAGSPELCMYVTKSKSFCFYLFFYFLFSICVEAPFIDKQRFLLKAICLNSVLQTGPVHLFSRALRCKEQLVISFHLSVWGPPPGKVISGQIRQF